MNIFVTGVALAALCGLAGCTTTTAVSNAPAPGSLATARTAQDVTPQWCRQNDHLIAQAAMYGGLAGLNPIAITQSMEQQRSSYLQSHGLPGCTTTTAVSIGNGEYEMAGSSATAFATGSMQKMRILERASAFCKQRGEHLVVVSAQDKNGKYGSLYQNSHKASADVIFRCQ